MHFIDSKCICILFLPEQWKCCTKPTQLFYFTSWDAHILWKISPFSLLMNKGEMERKGTLDCFFFFFSSRSSFSGSVDAQCRRVTWVGKSTVGFSGHSCFLERCFFLHSEQVQVQKESEGEGQSVTLLVIWRWIHRRSGITAAMWEWGSRE